MDAQSITTSSSFFKCNSCSIQFPNSDAQRYHMKTDWHRYNLKRRVASLQPVDAAIYSEKVQQSRNHQDERDEFGFRVIKPKEKKPYTHRPRGRVAEILQHAVERDGSPVSVTSELSHLSMGDSVYSHPATHTDVDSNFGTASEHTVGQSDADYEDDAELDSEEDDFEGDDYVEEPLQPITSCIFCGIPHADLEQNVSHMFKSHGLYIPERTYLTDLRGLLEFLISVIVIDNECLCCGFTGRNLESIRAHVASKGHCRLPYESKEERALFARFYDFSSNDAIAPKSKSEKAVGFEDEEMAGESSHEGDGINDNYTVARVESDVALSLPNGSRLGHRSVQRIYRPHSVPRDPADSQLTVASADKRFGGLTSMEYKKDVLKPKMIERREQQKIIRKETKASKRLYFQEHYRDPMLGG